MALLKVTSPHARDANSTSSVMLNVIMATLPGAAVLSFFFGVGTIINLVLCSAFCLLFESAILAIRHRPVLISLKDYSALVTAVLLALALPPYAPWWLLAVGCFFAIVIAKQLYGGLGFNPFNPAMIGYVVLLISFPLEMSQWPVPAPIQNNTATLPSLSEAFYLVFHTPVSAAVDGYTAATPLDVLKQNSSLLVSDLYQTNDLFAKAHFAGVGWEWVNFAFLLGGAYLLYKKVFTWHAPIAMLVTLGLLAAVFYDGGSSSSSGSPLFHWFSGATMLGAFFIVTDPVTSATSNRGRLIYGSLIGLLIFIIRVWGNYPDAVAFSVLLMNFAAPFLDYYTRPRTYGHANKKV